MRTSRLLSSLVAAAALSAIAAPAANAAPAPDPSAKPNSIYCEPNTSWTYTDRGWVWASYDSGTLDNRSGGTISKAYTHTASYSLASTKSGDISLTLSYGIASVNGKYGWSTTTTAAYTKSQAFTVTAPPYTKVSYRDGVIKRTVAVKQHILYSNCQTKDSTGFLILADDYSQAS